jgi:hypothetical protein
VTGVPLNATTNELNQHLFPKLFRRLAVTSFHVNGRKKPKKKGKTEIMGGRNNEREETEEGSCFNYEEQLRPQLMNICWIGVLVKFTLFLSDFNRAVSFLADFNKNPQCKISRQFVLREPSCFMCRDAQTCQD